MLENLIKHNCLSSLRKKVVRKVQLCFRNQLGNAVQVKPIETTSLPSDHTYISRT